MIKINYKVQGKRKMWKNKNLQSQRKIKFNSQKKVQQKANKKMSANKKNKAKA